MNLIEAAKFLTVSAALTGREPSEEQAAAWSVVLDDIPLDDALAALRAHYRVSRFPIMPADIVEQVAAAKVARERDDQRALARRRQRASNRQHRDAMIADGRTPGDDDVVWPGVGWAGDGQDDSLTTTVPASTIESRSA